MAEITCPSCETRVSLGSAPDKDAACTSCGAPLFFGRRFALTGSPLGDLGVDTADAAAPLYEGLDIETGERVLVRKTTVGDMTRVDREARILRGLSVRGLPTLKDDQTLAGVGRALVFTHPGTVTLEAALERGLRTDGTGGERFLRTILEILREIHALSPPVFHRHVCPHTVFFDVGGAGGRAGVTLVDFARATDVKGDAESDPVVARAGYAPRGRVDPVALDLYGAAATTVHLLTRTPLDKLPHDDAGRPRFREAANVSAHLASVLDRLLDVRGRDRFDSADEALAALSMREKTMHTRGPIPLALAAAGALMVCGAAAGMLLLQPTAMAPTVIVVEPPVQATPPPTRLSPEPPAHAEPQSPPEPPAVPVRQPPKGERAPPPPPAPPLSSDQARIDALRRAIERKRPELLACVRDDDDRWRFAGEASGAGVLTSLRARDKARSLSTQCVAKALDGVQFENKSGRPFTSEVTIFVRPSFRVTVF